MRLESWRGNAHIRLKYGFADEEPRGRFRTLMLRIMNTLADIGGQQSVSDPPVVAWQYYAQIHERRLSNLDEAIFEMAHLIAGLAAVDGAVVLTKRMELLGFGAEIGGSLMDVPDVARATDAEGQKFEIEPTTDVGTRHRSAFRLCHAVRDALAIVISQDGEVRFVACKDDQSDVLAPRHGPPGAVKSGWSLAEEERALVEATMTLLIRSLASSGLIFPGSGRIARRIVLDRSRFHA